MKKFTSYFFILLMIATSTAMAGDSFAKKKNDSARHGNTNHVLTTPFYLEDFASGIPATWQNVDNAASGVVWRFTTTGATGSSFPCSGAMSNAGTSAANGYVIFDSDSAFPAAGDADLISAAINCSARTNVHLTFASFFAQWNTSQGIVSVSNDSITWTDVYNAEAGLAPNSCGANPDLQDIDISTYAAGMATVYVKFRYVGTAEYFWQVDDVAMYEVAAADGGVTNISAPVTSCSLLSATEPVTIEVTNFGATDLDSTTVVFIADNLGLNMETITDTIHAGATYTYTFTATADLSANIAHNIIAYTMVPSDADASNDQFSATMYSGPHMVYSGTDFTQGFETSEDQSGWTAIDANVDTVTWGLSGVLAHTGTECENFSHELPTNQANDYLFSTCIGLSDSNDYQLDFWYRNFSPAYQANLEVLLCTGQDPATAVATLVPNMLVATALWTLSSSTISIPQGSSGSYYVAWHVTQQDSSTSLKIDDVNIHFAQPNGIKNISNSAFVLYPNPTTGLVNISGIKVLTEITVLDMLGNIVLNQTANAGIQVLDLRKQTAGVYSVVMRSEKSVLTKQLIIANR